MSLKREDIMFEIYEEIQRENLKEQFDRQIEKMKSQDKHRFKNVVEKWEYALYRIKGGPSKDRY